ncbi:MAG: hypothetical protein QOJ69_252 [Actinomycetota bacterium]|nr:hypothetical protein [Actinomycetota bacterium]
MDEDSPGASIEESLDLHADAMRAVHPSISSLVEIRGERGARREEVDPGEIDRFNLGRRRLLAGLSLTAGGMAAAGGGLGTLVTAILATPARADKPLDVQILQTASSLERLLVDTYAIALGRGPLGIAAPAVAGIAAIAVPGAKDFLTKFLDTTHSQHDEHRTAFQTLTTALGGKVQDGPNPKYASAAAAANLGTPVQLVDYATVLEKIVTDTYLLDLSLLEDVRSKERMAAVMGVEAQHLATLRAVSALLKVGALDSIKLPADVTKLPAAFGSLAFPDALHKANESTGVAQPESGSLA